MSTRPLSLADPGKFELSCHDSPPTVYPEESHGTVQVCIPLEHAAYTATRLSEAGTRLTHQLGARDILVLPARQPHAVVWRQPAFIVSLQLCESFIAEAADRPRVRLPDSLVIRDRFASAVAAELRDTIVSEGGIDPVFGEALITAITCRVVRRSADPRVRPPAGAQPLSSRQLARIEEFIEAHLDGTIRLAQLSALAGMSRWHFIRRFTASRGLSPYEFISRRRVARAQTLLASSDLSVTQIALDIGMSHSHFSRTFLSRTGLSPTEFRRQHML